MRLGTKKVTFGILLRLLRCYYGSGRADTVSVTVKLATLTAGNNVTVSSSHVTGL